MDAKRPALGGAWLTIFDVFVTGAPPSWRSRRPGRFAAAGRITVRSPVNLCIGAAVLVLLRAWLGQGGGSFRHCRSPIARASMPSASGSRRPSPGRGRLSCAAAPCSAARLDRPHLLHPRFVPDAGIRCSRPGGSRASRTSSRTTRVIFDGNILSPPLTLTLGRDVPQALLGAPFVLAGAIRRSSPTR
jgi:hypothetical protein